MQSANRSHKLVKVHSTAVPTRCQRAASERNAKNRNIRKGAEMKTLMLEWHKRRKKARRRRFFREVFQQYLSAAATDNCPVIAYVVLRSMRLFIVYADSASASASHFMCVWLGMCIFCFSCIRRLQSHLHMLVDAFLFRQVCH